MDIERTPLANSAFQSKVSGMTTPVTTADTPSRFTPKDPFEDDTPLTCGLENPESCESCQ